MSASSTPRTCVFVVVYALGGGAAEPEPPPVPEPPVPLAPASRMPPVPEPPQPPSQPPHHQPQHGTESRRRSSSDFIIRTALSSRYLSRSSHAVLPLNASSAPLVSS